MELLNTLLALHAAHPPRGCLRDFNSLFHPPPPPPPSPRRRWRLACLAWRHAPPLARAARLPPRCDRPALSLRHAGYLDARSITWEWDRRKPAVPLYTRGTLGWRRPGRPTVCGLVGRMPTTRVNLISHLMPLVQLAPDSLLMLWAERRPAAPPEWYPG